MDQEQHTMERGGEVVADSEAVEVPGALRNLIEALIFAAKEPLTISQIQTLFNGDGLNGEARQISGEEIVRIVEELNEEFRTADKPYRIVPIAGGYQFATLQAYVQWLGRLHKEQAKRKLSQSSLETLAIIAYKQPIATPEIETIRGVNCDYVLGTLLEKGMITIVGRAPTVGRPLLYGTTKEFLKHFGLNDVRELPRPREIEEILGERQYEAERRMLEAQAAGKPQQQEEEFKSRLPHIPRRKPGLDEEVKIVPKKRDLQLKLTPEKGAEAEVSKQEGLQASGHLAHEESFIADSAEQWRVNIAHSRSEEQQQKSGEEELISIESMRSTVERTEPIFTENGVQAMNEETLAPITAYLNRETSPSPEILEQDQPHQPKSRWQTWKEKIQGFLQKLFG